MRVEIPALVLLALLVFGGEHGAMVSDGATNGEPSSAERLTALLSKQPANLTLHVEDVTVHRDPRVNRRDFDRDVERRRVTLTIAIIDGRLAMELLNRIGACGFREHGDPMTLDLTYRLDLCAAPGDCVFIHVDKFGHVLFEGRRFVPRCDNASLPRALLILPEVLTLQER